MQHKYKETQNEKERNRVLFLMCNASLIRTVKWGVGVGRGRFAWLGAFNKLKDTTSTLGLWGGRVVHGARPLTS